MFFSLIFYISLKKFVPQNKMLEVYYKILNNNSEDDFLSIEEKITTTKNNMRLKAYLKKWVNT